MRPPHPAQGHSSHLPLCTCPVRTWGPHPVSFLSPCTRKGRLASLVGKGPRPLASSSRTCRMEVSLVPATLCGGLPPAAAGDLGVAGSDGRPGSQVSVALKITSGLGDTRREILRRRRHPGQGLRPSAQVTAGSPGHRHSEQLLQLCPPRAWSPGRATPCGGRPRDGEETQWPGQREQPARAPRSDRCALSAALGDVLVGVTCALADRVRSGR